MLWQKVVVNDGVPASAGMTGALAKGGGKRRGSRLRGNDTAADWKRKEGEEFGCVRRFEYQELLLDF